MRILATGPFGPSDELDLRLALDQILAAGRDEVPAHVVNPEAIPGWRRRR